MTIKDSLCQIEKSNNQTIF